MMGIGALGTEVGEGKDDEGLQCLRMRSKETLQMS
jgi:hypothetical protein